MSSKYNGASTEDRVEPVETPTPDNKRASTTGPGDPDGIQDLLDEQDQEAEEFAKKFLMAILRLRGVHIEREHFLKSELHKRGIGPEGITQAVQDSPAAVGIDPALLDEIAQASIDFERNKTSSISFAAGLPGVSRPRV